GSRLAAGEPDRHAAGEGRLARSPGAVGEVELDGVLGDLQESGSSLGIDAGQVGRGHAVSDSFYWSPARSIQPRVLRPGRGDSGTSDPRRRLTAVRACCPRWEIL